MFILAVFGLPYLMGKLIKALAKTQEEEEKRRREANPQLFEHDGQFDPSKPNFYKVLFDFTPDTHNENVQGIDLAVKKGDMVAVISKTDPLGNPSEWWQCGTRDRRIGYLPSTCLEPIQKRQPAAITSGSQSGSPIGSRAQTLTNTASLSGSRAGTMTEKVPIPARQPPKVEGKVGDITVESFQKGQFYS
jgi:peroxin-13